MNDDVSIAASPEQAKLKALDELFAMFDRSNAPGLVVGVSKNGKSIYRKGLGMASLELGVANTPRTRMRIGSTSKQFVALAALLLVEEGKLDLDASVRRVIPEFPSTAGTITLRDFLTHTSGHRCDIDVGFLAEGMAVRPMGFTLATMVRQSASNFERGEKFIYNNGGFHLVSIAIERASGMPYEQFLEERIFRPLGLQDTDSVPSDLQLTPGMAALHVGKPGGIWRRGIFPSDEIRGEGGIISTVDDMLSWMAHLRAPRKTIGSAQTWDALLSPARLRGGFPLPYCLGIMRHPYRGVEVIHHPGGVVGGLCQALTVPEHELDIVVMLNSDAASPIELANKVVDLMLAEVLAPVEAILEPSRFSAVIGKTYACTRSGLAFRFEQTGGKLALALINAPPIALHDGETHLRLAAEEIAVGPFLIGKTDVEHCEEAPQHLKVLEGPVSSDFELVPATRPEVFVAGLPLLGLYECADIGGSATVVREGDSLLMHIRGTVAGNTLVLKPLMPDMFEWTCPANSHVPMAGVLCVERDEGGSVAALRVNTWRTRDLRFQRAAG